MKKKLQTIVVRCDDEVNKVYEWLNDEYPSFGWDIYESHPMDIRGSSYCNVYGYDRQVLYSPNGDGHPAFIDHDGLDPYVLADEIYEHTNIHTLIYSELRCE